MSKNLGRLPEVLQTPVQQKFFDATFDQVFSKKDSDYLSGYIGRRDTAAFDPLKDFYIPQNSKERTQYQLEPVGYTRDSLNERSNISFYSDLVDAIKANGGNVTNHDRLFNDEFYSWSPPIDLDMFINYQNYYWINQGLPVIQIKGVKAVDIIGKPTFRYEGVELTTGMCIDLVDDPSIDGQRIVEFTESGIILTLISSQLYASSSFEYLPWDGENTLPTGRTIKNSHWDGNTWDVQLQPGSADYITIQRGSPNRNAWSRTNRWYHIDTINAVCTLTGSSFPVAATPALRPIIHFH